MYAERFQSLIDENKLLSLSFWEDEEAISLWRNLFEHRLAQKKEEMNFLTIIASEFLKLLEIIQWIKEMKFLKILKG